MTEAASKPQDADHSDAIIDCVTRARENAAPLYIRGGNSKAHLLARDCQGTALDVSNHRGIVDYQPGELVITARAGTALTDIVSALHEEGQILAFEPPLCSGAATLGGTLACNLSGPARPWAGSIRDHVLGIELINGRAERLRFGGSVMKNVAGYDVSRLQAGALGTLGVLTEISVKVMPQPEQTLTLGYELQAEEALEQMILRAAQPKPLCGACWIDGMLYLRLAGASSAVTATAKQWGGEQITGTAPWENLREWTLPFFATEQPLWRMSLSATAALQAQPDTAKQNGGDLLIDWGGAQRWLRGDHSLDELQRTAATAGGHVVKFRGGDRNTEVRSQPSAVERRLHTRLKEAFDPAGIFNPGRLYSWL